MWTVIEFDDGVQLVPSQWIQNDLCKWPPLLKPEKITKAIKENVLPESTLEIFPLKTNEELMNLENTLQDKEYYSKLVAALKLMGGVVVHQTVYNIMKKILTNSLAEQYSFLGAKKKRCFKNLKLSKLILASTRARHPDITETDYSEIVSKWLVQAKLRLERQHSKEEKEKQKQGEGATDP